MTPRTGVRLVTLAAAAALALSPAFGQGRGTGSTGTPPAGGTGAAGAGGTTTGSPGRGTIPSTQPSQQQQTPQTLPPPIFINGRVVMEDGSPLTEIVTIERVCNGQAHSEGYTDIKGYFGIELGARNNGVLQDASEYGPDTFDVAGRSGSGLGGFGSSSNPLSMGADRFMNCELRAKLAGYRSQTISLALRRPLDDPNVGVILLHKIGAQEGGTVSAVSLAAPKDARKAFDKGMDGLKKRKPEEAEKNFEKAVQIYPKYATAWQQLGVLQAKAGKNEEAKKSFQTAMESDPKFTDPYLQLSLIALQAKDWKEAADLSDRLVKLDPFSYPQGYFFNSVANYNLKNVDAVEKAAREAERLDTRH
ncbi:MAG TPA: tetratricopeptide repeat protein [Bryobacteraceae bacterium]